MKFAINILAELEEIGVKPVHGDDEWVRVICPFHNDNTASLGISTVTQALNCFGCQDAKGDFTTYLARKKHVTIASELERLSLIYGLSNEKPLPVDKIEGYHDAIWTSKPLLTALYDRGLTDEIIRRYRLGMHQGRITIPLKSQSGQYVAIRSYLPGAPADKKMKNLKGRGKLTVYPLDQLKYDKLVLCGGECKALACIPELNAAGIGVVCITGGEGTWHRDLDKFFRGKSRVAIIFDIDLAGVKGAEAVARNLFSLVGEVNIVHLPLDINEFPKGDVNDYIGEKKGKVLPLLKNLEAYTPNEIDLQDSLSKEPAKQATLSTALHAKNVGKRLQFEAIVGGLEKAPYAIPKTVQIQCTREDKACSLCPIKPQAEDKEYLLPAEHEDILAMLDVTKAAQQQAIKSCLGIPEVCRVSKAVPIDYYNIESGFLNSNISIERIDGERTSVPSVIIGDNLELNGTYKFTGRPYPNPKSGQLNLLISEYETSQDDLSTHVLSTQMAEDLKIFRPSEWSVEGISEKLEELYTDIESNVTRIYKRKTMHLAFDLVYHSPLHIDFDGRKNQRGWVELLMIGDSAQGKSAVDLELRNHYKLGEKFPCKNATIAGILGGLEQVAGKWFVQWGVIPQHDRRMVSLEELKGISQEVIGKLTDMRSSGIAEIPKIEKRRALARCRLAMISNPRDELKINQMNYGIDAIRKLIGAPEDVRRFDFCFIVAEGDVKSEDINMLAKHRPDIEHKFTGELCRELILWVWAGNKAVFEDAAEDCVLDVTARLCKDFTDHIPIIDKGSTRHKIAKLSAALAGRTYSCDDNGNVLVRVCHVEYIYEFLNKHYSSRAFGYKEFTAAKRIEDNLKGEDEIRKILNQHKHGEDVVQGMLNRISITVNDVTDLVGDRTMAQEFVGLLVRKNALINKGKGYYKTGAFTQFLRDIELSKLPEHLREKNNGIS